MYGRRLSHKLIQITFLFHLGINNTDYAYQKSGCIFEHKFLSPEKNYQN